MEEPARILLDCSIFWKQQTKPKDLERPYGKRFSVGLDLVWATSLQNNNKFYSILARRSLSVANYNSKTWEKGFLVVYQNWNGLWILRSGTKYAITEHFL